MTFWPWVNTTLPSRRTVLAFMSKMPLSPVAIWSFWVTTTLPLASTRLIDEDPAGPGCAAFIAPGLADSLCS